jgi:hypothetical protein
VVTLDTTSFDRAFTAFMSNSKRDVKVVLRQQAKLLTSDCAKLTPPFSKAVFGNPASESFAAQKRIGDNAVKTQITGLFMPASKLRDVQGASGPKIADALKRYISSGEFQKFKTYLDRRKIQTPFVEGATAGLHSAARDRRGRVRPKLNMIVLKADTIRELLKLKLSHVGRAKAGWKKAAALFGLNLPTWITRHETLGDARDDSDDPTNPSITIQNLVPYASELAADPTARIIERALGFRTRAMLRQLEHYQNKRAQEFSR